MSPFDLRIPSCCYGTETLGQRTVLHAFRRIAQRDGWMDQAPNRRVATAPSEAGIAKSWDRFEVVLHADDTPRLKL